MGFWSCKESHKTQLQLQFFSITHSPETQSISSWLSVNPSSGFRSCYWSVGMLHLLCAIFKEHMLFSNCLSSVSMLVVTTSLSLATSCHDRASRVEHTATHLSVSCSSSGFITGCCIKRGQDCPKGPWLVPLVRKIAPKKQVIKHNWGRM